MSFMSIYAVPNTANALPYNQLTTAPETFQAVADYTAKHAGLDAYNNATGLLANAHTWLFMGMNESQFKAQVNNFLGVD